MWPALPLILLSIFSSFFSALEKAQITTVDEYQEAFIQNVLMAESWRRSRVRDVIFDAEQIIKDDKGKEKARFKKKIYMKFLPDTTLFGPSPTFTQRVRGRFRWQILIRGPDPLPLLRQLHLPQGWAIDIDPVSLV